MQSFADFPDQPPAKKDDFSDFPDQPVVQPEAPGFLSRSEDFLKGTYDFGKNLLGSAINYPGSREALFSGLADLGKQTYKDVTTGHPIAGLARIASYSPENISEDFKSGRWGALAGDILPQIAL